MQTSREAIQRIVTYPQVFDPLTQDRGITAYLTGEFGAALAVAGIVVAGIFWRLRPKGDERA